MSEQLSSDAAKGFAVAGATILGVIAVNHLRKLATRAWRNRNSDEKSDDTTKK